MLSTAAIHYYNGEIPTWLAVNQDIKIFVGIGNANNGIGSISGISYSETLQCLGV